METSVDRVAQFRFDSSRFLKVRVIRECHLADRNGAVLPLAPDVVSWLKQRVNGRHDCYNRGLSSGQLKEETPDFCDLNQLKRTLLFNDDNLTVAETAMGFRRLFFGVATFRSHCYDPKFSNVILRPVPPVISIARQIASVCVLVGMPDGPAAIKAYNFAIGYLPVLLELGYIHDSERLRAFRSAINLLPDLPIEQAGISFVERLINDQAACGRYKDWDDFCQSDRARSAHIFIAPCGSVGFRVFDTTDDLDLIVFWATVCQSLCSLAINS